jgi:Gas vesicle protein G
MGLITGILTLPFAPVRGVVWVIELVRDEAERRYYDPAAIRRQLDQVDQARRSGELSEDECAAIEDDLLARLMHRPGTGSGGGGQATWG